MKSSRVDLVPVTEHHAKRPVTGYGKRMIRLRRARRHNTTKISDVSASVALTECVIAACSQIAKGIKDRCEELVPGWWRLNSITSVHKNPVDLT